MSGLVKVSYVNASGVAIPPWGIVQCSGASSVTATNDYVLSATQPTGASNKAYLIDDGKGASAAGPQSYGSGFRLGEGAGWVLFTGDPTTLTPWQEVGPTGGSFTVSSSGKGYFYAGISDAANGRIQVILKPQGGSGGMVMFELTEVDCVDKTATGIPVLSQSGTSLPDTNQFVMDNMCCWLTGNPLLLDGQLAWCVPVVLPDYPIGICVPGNLPVYDETLWSIVSMCSVGSNCA